MSASNMTSHELVIDSFAGGGGASEGIRAALGRDPDIALNHDPMALAMHRMNHPGTRHIEEDVVTVDARAMCKGRPIGMLWMSPDCKHHSKAKGGKPRDKQIRGLAWTAVGWVKRLPVWQRPRVVFLENVEEFGDWGPLLEDGTPCPLQKGAIFRQFVSAWEALGYVVEWRERRACDAGAPTIRKRLYMIMRRDGAPIVWPAATHGDPKSDEVRSGRLKPWRTAAEIIDWSLPCPSIFDTSAEIKEWYGIRAIRPLADNTMARIAKGTMRYVVTAAKPFLVRVNHGDSRGRRDRGLDEPLPTETHFGGDGLVTPFVTKFNRGATGHPVDQPLHTITSHASETHGGGAAPLGIVAPFLSPRYQEKPGAEPRVRSVMDPAATIVAGDNVPGHLAAVHLSRQFGASVGSAAHEPVGTITAGGAGKAAVVAAFLAQHNNDARRIGGVNPGQPVDKPLSTITATGGQQGLVAAHLTHAYTSNTRGGEGDLTKPIKTVMAGGQHAAAVYAFLTKYYGAGVPSQAVEEPVHTLTTKPRHGLVTVAIGGEPFVIVDIGMRMLTPGERFSAQSFRPDYVIDRGLKEDGSTVAFTLEQQGRFVGNSVCPVEAEALVGANFVPRSVSRPRGRDVGPMLELVQRMEAAE